MRLRFPIVAVVIFFALCVAVPLLVQNANERELRVRIKEDAAEFAASDTGRLHTWYPELLTHVADNGTLAAKVSSVSLTGIRSDGDYSALTRFPNLERVEISYGNRIGTIIPLLSSCDRLKSVDLYYCDLTERDLDSLHSSTLERFGSHDFGVSIPEDAIERARLRLPSCKITISGD